MPTFTRPSSTGFQKLLQNPVSVPSHWCCHSWKSTVCSEGPYAAYIPVRTSRLAKNTAIRVQTGSLLGLCLRPVAGIVVALREETQTLVTGCPA